MNKEKEIEEMIEVLVNKHFEKNPHEYITDMPRTICSALVEAGYRKADEVRKETAKEILRELWANAEFEPLYDNDDGGYVRLGELEQLAEKYGVEVDE